jgi:hypothetical protein
VEPFNYEWTLEGNSVSRERQWTYHSTKGENDSGTKMVRVRISDQHGQSVEKSWSLTVTAVNEPPRVITVLPPKAAVELVNGEEQSFSLEVEDPERGELEYEWAVDGRKTGVQPTFTWKAQGEGKHRVKAIVRDHAGLSVSQEWHVAVVAAPPPLTPPSPLPTNTAPRIAQRLPTEHLVSAREGEPVQFSALALDPDGEEIAYRWSVDGKRVAQGDRFIYTAGVVGKHFIELEAVDKGGLKDSLRWEVQVEAPPAAPRVTMYTPHKERLQLYAHLSRFFGIEVETPGMTEPPIQYGWQIDGRPIAGRELLEFKNQPPGRSLIMKSVQTRNGWSSKGGFGI